MLSQNNKNVNRILLTGGGTSGSVSPLLGIVETLTPGPSPTPDVAGEGGDTEKSLLAKGVRADFDFLWLGTKKGPERGMIASANSVIGANIKFKYICGGKLRRYFSLKNFTDIFYVIVGFFQSLIILLKWKPNLIISAGSFIGVPAVWAAWILRVPVIIHQQDIRAGVANKLMAPFARVITVTFEVSLKSYGKKAVWTGNPIRHIIKNYNSKNQFNLSANLPIIFVIGGGTGATAINELIWEGLDKILSFSQVIHVVGKNKESGFENLDKKQNYHCYGFLDAEELSGAYNVADIVVSRCGMGVLTELSYLEKPSILIPMPDSHQEENAKIFKDKEAAIVLNQKELTSEILTDNIKKLLDDEGLRNTLRNNIKGVMKRGANEKIVEIIKSILR